MKTKIVTVIGARPQFIKAAALSRQLKKKYAKTVNEIIVHTGQHYDKNMSSIFFEELKIPIPNYNLNIGSGSHAFQTSKMIEGIEKILIKEKPEYLIVYGDTNSTLAGAIAAAKLHIKIVHIEAGIRSFNKKMPEEVNRVICDHLSTYLFTPTKTGYSNLIKEGFVLNNTHDISSDKPAFYHCGDIMYDNSIFFSEKSESKNYILKNNNLIKDNYVLLTVHRDHNTDNKESLTSIFRAINIISQKIKVVIPLHPRTEIALKKLKDKKFVKSLYKNILFIPPVSFLEMIQLEKYSKLIITDSGGVQKESYFFNKPCIVLRPESEWIEILETGFAKLVSADYDKILKVFNEFYNAKIIDFPSIFGDGKASSFICNKLF